MTILNTIRILLKHTKVYGEIVLDFFIVFSSQGLPYLLSQLERASNLAKILKTIHDVGFNFRFLVKIEV